MDTNQSHPQKKRISPTKRRWARSCGTVLAVAIVLPACGAPEEAHALSSSEAAVLTSRNDNYRTGAQIREKKLRPEKINVDNFGLQFTRQVDGKIYAQLLYVPKVRTADGHKHDIVYAATAHNTVYAFDANDETRTEPLWSKNLGPSVPVADTASATRTCANMTPEVGITGTPTIDWPSETMYLVAKIKENGLWFNRLFALDIASGDLRRPPVDIAGSVEGTGDTSVNGVLTFEGRRHNQRPGLLLLNGVLYIAFASHCDVPPHHGWIFAYDANKFERKAVWSTTPNGEAGAIWQSGVGLSADDDGRVYFTSGQGVYPPYVGRVQNGFGQTVGKLFLHNDTFELEDWFIPSNVVAQNDADQDMSFGPIIIPHTNLAASLMMGRFKPAKMYILQRNNFGHFHDNAADEITQTVEISDPDFTADPLRTQFHRANSIAYWNGRLYSWTQNDFPRAYAIEGSSVSSAPVATGTTKVFSSSVTGMLSISADDKKDGVLWGSVIVEPDVPTSSNAIGKTVVYAFDAITLQELWNSRQNQARDEVGSWPKWPQPVVADGKLFVVNHDNQVKVYGLFDEGDDE
ncbi:MAG: hypothetical protein ACREA0_02600 [bacterium]